VAPLNRKKKKLGQKTQTTQIHTDGGEGEKEEKKKNVLSIV